MDIQECGQGPECKLLDHHIILNMEAAPEGVEPPLKIMLG